RDGARGSRRCRDRGTDRCRPHAPASPGLRSQGKFRCEIGLAYALPCAQVLGHSRCPMSKKMTLEEHADEIRKDLAVPRQADVFKAAVEAGYLVALADSGVDATEREVLVKAVEMLSKGLIIEWETDALIEEFAKRAEAEGIEKCSERVGNVLKETGQGEAG